MEDFLNERTSSVASKLASTVLTPNCDSKMLCLFQNFLLYCLFSKQENTMYAFATISQSENTFLFLNNDYDKLKYHSFNIVLTDSVHTFNKCFIINQLRMIYNESLLIETLYIVLKIYVLISYSFLSLHAALKHQIAHVLIRIFQVQR